MQVPLLDLKQQYAMLKDEILQEIAEVCASQQFILGPKVEEFENNNNYLLKLPATATATATVAPTIGLLPIPRKPIIST